MVQYYYCNYIYSIIWFTYTVFSLQYNTVLSFTVLRIFIYSIITVFSYTVVLPVFSFTSIITIFSIYSSITYFPFTDYYRIFYIPSYRHFHLQLLPVLYTVLPIFIYSINTVLSYSLPHFHLQYYYHIFIYSSTVFSFTVLLPYFYIQYYRIFIYSIITVFLFTVSVL